MEANTSSPNPGLLHVDVVSDPDDKEFSEDDDRNPKHQSREEYLGSLEGDSSDQLFFTGPYRKQNKSFGNGYPLRESVFSSNDTWKNYNNANQETDLSASQDCSP